jgi:hypothetical protein
VLEADLDELHTEYEKIEQGYDFTEFIGVDLEGA